MTHLISFVLLPEHILYSHLAISPVHIERSLYILLITLSFYVKPVYNNMASVNKSFLLSIVAFIVMFQTSLHFLNFCDDVIPWTKIRLFIIARHFWIALFFLSFSANVINWSVFFICQIRLRELKTKKHFRWEIWSRIP